MIVGDNKDVLNDIENIVVDILIVNSIIVTENDSGRSLNLDIDATNSINVLVNGVTNLHRQNNIMIDITSLKTIRGERLLNY